MGWRVGRINSAYRLKHDLDRRSKPSARAIARCFKRQIPFEAAARKRPRTKNIMAASGRRQGRRDAISGRSTRAEQDSANSPDWRQGGNEKLTQIPRGVKRPRMGPEVLRNDPASPATLSSHWPFFDLSGPLSEFTLPANVHTFNKNRARTTRRRFAEHTFRAPENSCRDDVPAMFADSPGILC